jgi:hypothetical protein
MISLEGCCYHKFTRTRSLKGRKRWNNKEILYENKYNNRQFKKKGHGDNFMPQVPVN